MIFTCATSRLLEALNAASHALSARSTIPILEGVLLETGIDELKITCSDGTLTIVATLPANVLDPGRAVLPGKLFLEITRKLPEGEVKGELNERMMLILRCAGNRTTLPAKDADQFPEIPFFDARQNAELPQTMLRDMIQRTSFAVSGDESRRILTGGLLEVKRGVLCMVAIDGFRMALRCARVSPDLPDTHCVIPGRELDEIAKILTGGEDDMVTLKFGQSQIMAIAGSVRLYAPILEGNFIDYRAVPPKSFSTRAVFNRSALAECVERAALLAREGKTNLLCFNFADGNASISANTPAGEVYEELDARVEGAEVEIAFNVKYLIDTLRAVDDEFIEMRILNATSPCCVFPVDGDAFLYVILPLRLHA